MSRLTSVGDFVVVILGWPVYGPLNLGRPLSIFERDFDTPLPSEEDVRCFFCCFFLVLRF